jgi:hypothetical protein
MDKLGGRDGGRIRYHLDEHIARAVAVGLRSRGIDLTTTVDAGLTAADDESSSSTRASQAGCW